MCIYIYTLYYITYYELNDCHQTVNVNESSWQQLELSLPKGTKLSTVMENRPFLFDRMTLACPGWGKLSPQKHDAFCKTGSSIGWASKKSGREFPGGCQEGKCSAEKIV